MKNIWWARIYCLFGVMIYIMVGGYLNSLNLPPHYDPILDLIPVIDVAALSTYALVLIYFLAFIYLKPLLNSRKEVEFWTIFASIIILRTGLCLSSGFGPPIGYLIPDNGIYSLLQKMQLLFCHDFFFSGHTAMPFFFFLFFESRMAKIIFLAGMILMAVSVLLLHHHYAIDVFSAPFFSWAVYSFFKFQIFKKNRNFWKSFRKGGENENGISDRGLRIYRLTFSG